MKKFLILIPLVFVFISACADIEELLSKQYTDDNSTNQPVNPGDNNGGQTNPGGNGDNNGTTTDPVEPGGDGDNNGTTTDPVEPGGDGNDNGTTTDPVEPGGDGNDNGTTTDPVEPGGDGNDNGTTTDPVEPGGDGNDNGTTTDPIEPGGDGNDNGTTTDPVEPGGDGNDNSTTTDPENPADKPGYDTTFNAKTDVFQPQFYYGRSFLNENEQKTYDHILKNLLEFNVTDENKDKYLICVPLYSDGVKLEYTTDVLKILAKITSYIAYDEQRITYLYSVAPKGPTGTRLTYTYDSIDRKYYTNEACFNVRNVTDQSGLYGAKLADTKAKYDEEMTIVEEGVVAILSKLKEDMTDAQKFRVIHDEFLKRVSYGQKDEGTGDIRGGFIYNKVFCEGYARTLAYLCQRAGIECIYVVGTASYSGNGDGGSNAPFDHAWNKVKLDGKWYNVDPTNNDSIDPTSEGIVYNDFLLSDIEFNDDHEAGITAGLTGTRQQTSYPSFPEANESMDLSLTEYNK